MQFDKQVVIDELNKQGQFSQVQKLLDELPQIDHDQHAVLLQKFGLGPGRLAEKAAKTGLAKL